jgi:ureidoglycolate amidohydrolase
MSATHSAAQRLVQCISRIAPVAMLFIPCRNGYSHRPDEYASVEDIACGALVLAETLASLSA